MKMFYLFISILGMFMSCQNEMVELDKGVMTRAGDSRVFERDFYFISDGNGVLSMPSFHIDNALDWKGIITVSVKPKYEFLTFARWECNYSAKTNSLARTQ